MELLAEMVLRMHLKKYTNPGVGLLSHNLLVGLVLK